MKETIRLYADFALAMTCALLGVSFEYVAQGLIYTGRWLQHRADWLQAAALRIAGLDGIEDERAGRI